MPERIVQRVRNFTPDLYLTVPFTIKKKFGTRRGDRLVCFVEKALDSGGKLLREINREVACNIAGRDGRFYLPPSLSQEFNLSGTEYLDVVLLRLIKPNGREIEIHPDAKV